MRMVEGAAELVLDGRPGQSKYIERDIIQESSTSGSGMLPRLTVLPNIRRPDSC
jgi:hypothetical protein